MKSPSGELTLLIRDGPTTTSTIHPGAGTDRPVRGDRRSDNRVPRPCRDRSPGERRGGSRERDDGSVTAHRQPPSEPRVGLSPGKVPVHPSPRLRSTAPTVSRSERVVSSRPPDPLPPGPLRVDRSLHHGVPSPTTTPRPLVRVVTGTHQPSVSSSIVARYYVSK